MTPERLQSLSRLLEALAIPAMVIGGLAVAVRGRPRMTRDADITLAAQPEALPEILERAALAGYISRVADAATFVARTRVLPLKRSVDGWEVDVIFAGSPYELEAIERSTREVLSGVTLPIISSEDLVIHKLLAGRPRDEEDAVSVVLTQGAHFERETVRQTLTDLADALADDELRRRVVRVLGR